MQLHSCRHSAAHRDTSDEILPTAAGHYLKVRLSSVHLGLNERQNDFDNVAQ